METLGLVLAVVALFASTVSLLGSIYAVTRPPRDLAKVNARLSDLQSIRQEWQNVLEQLDSMNRRAERLAKRASEVPPSPEPDLAPAGRRRTLTLAEVMGANRKKEA